MLKKAGTLAILIGALCMFFAGCATMQESSQQDFSWYGKSGAKKAPVYDAKKGGHWWVPGSAPTGKENTQWGNRGYVFVRSGKKAAPRKEIVRKPRPKMEDVYFQFNSAALTPLSIGILKNNAAVLREYPRIRVKLIGSASPEGESPYNMKLSERRVKAVKDFLVNKEGIAAERLADEAKGELAVPDRASWPAARKVMIVIE